MADTVEFELVSPERLLLSIPVEMVVVPGNEGDFGVLPGHAPMISTVRPGVISIWQDGAVDRRVFVAGGVAEVQPERCTVLAEDAVPLEEADEAEADRRAADAREALERADDEGTAAEARKRLAAAEALRTAIAGARG